MTPFLGHFATGSITSIANHIWQWRLHEAAFNIEGTIVRTMHGSDVIYI
jgi:hypothetical protein